MQKKTHLQVFIGIFWSREKNKDPISSWRKPTLSFTILTKPISVVLLELKFLNLHRWVTISMRYNLISLEKWNHSPFSWHDLSSEAFPKGSVDTSAKDFPLTTISLMLILVLCACSQDILENSFGCGFSPFRKKLISLLQTRMTETLKARNETLRVFAMPVWAFSNSLCGWRDK